MQESSKAAFFDRIASSILVVVLVLSPLFFVPFLGFGVEVGKTYFVALGVLVVFVCWIVARMIQGTIAIPKSPIVTAGLLLPVAFLISAIFSPAWRVSLSGLFLGSGTVVGISILVLAFVGGAVYLNSEKKIVALFKGLIIVTGIITLFQIIYLFAGAKYLNFGTFYSSVSNVVGKWNDLALWYGFVLVVLIMAFQFMDLSRRTKMVSGVIGVFSLLFLVLINFTTVWAILGFVSLLVFIYSIMVLRGGEEGTYKFPVVPFGILILSLFFFLANPIIGNFVAQKFGLAQTEVRPSLISTGHVIGQTLKQHPLVGVGPDRFTNAWYVNQPASIIATRFWNADFTSGSGFIPTVLVTTGLLGGVCLIVFLFLFLLTGIVQIARKGGDSKTHLYLVSSFMTAVFLWIAAFVYTPGTVILTFAFATSGMFIGILNASGRIPTRQIHFLKDPRHSFFSILFLVVLLLGALFTLFTGGEKFTSLALYSRAQTLASKSNLPGASDALSKAIALYPADTYYRANATLALSQLGKLLGDSSLSKDIVKSEFQNIFGTAENSSRAALAYDGTSPLNWINLSSLYQNVIPLQIAGAYDNAKAALAQAAKLSPSNPDINLLQARLEVANKNTDGAKTIIKAALQKKPNFIDGIFFLAELEVSDGDSATAIAQLEQVALADPRNASVFLELGVFKYDAADYTGAVSALERSITLDPTVLNTHYLLGLSYAKVGRTDEAKKVFSSIQKALPENQTITKILANLNAGQDPLAGLQQTANPIPESAASSSTAGTTAPKTTTTKTTTTPKTTPKK